MTHNIPPPHPHDHLTHPKYRPDIDGLRAVAILAVVAFHAFPNLVNGGFIGVDIFFVISGYLISTIIMGSLERDSFSFVDFYKRRVRRIFPALVLVLASCFVFGWFVLLSDEYKQLGKHIAGGAGFISNFVFWNESGYFDNAADTKPLLHLWSLGIEEQFYIVWPLLLWFAWKRRLNLLTITLAIAVISYGLDASKVIHDAVTAFYAPQLRFWELLAGAVLAHMALHKKLLLPNFRVRFDAWLGRVFYAKPQLADGAMLRNFQSTLGALFIAIGIAVITKDKNFPGSWALLPVLGAALIISAGANAWINRVILSNRVMVWVGLVSFPLYLWHWPVLSFARIVGGETPSNAIRFSAVLISIALAWLTYWLVEKPVRSGNHSKAKTITLVVLMVVVGYAGFNAYDRSGLPFRAFQKQLNVYTKSMVVSNRKSECFESLDTDYSNKLLLCNLGNKSIPPQFYAYGDSHSLSLLPALEKFANNTNSNILYSGTQGCPPLLGIQRMGSESDMAKHNCQRFNERIFEYVKENHIGSVILIGRWTLYTGGTTRPNEVAYISMDTTKEASKDLARESFRYGLKTTVERYKNIGVQVYFIEDNPQQQYSPVDATRRHMLTGEPINQFSVSMSEHQSDQSWVSNEFKQLGNGLAKTLNFDDILCSNQICPFMENDKFLYLDANHLSIDGAMLVYPKLAGFLSEPRHDPGHNWGQSELTRISRTP